MAGPRKVHEISDSDDDDVDVMSSVSKRSRQLESQWRLLSARDNATRCGSRQRSPTVPAVPSRNLKVSTPAAPSKRPRGEAISFSNHSSPSPPSASAVFASNRTAQSASNSSTRSASAGVPVSKSTNHARDATKKTPAHGSLDVKNGLKKNVEHLQNCLEDSPVEWLADNLSPLSEEDPTSRLSLGHDFGIEGSGTVPCPHGFMCYRTSPEHVQENSHESRARGFYLTKCEGIQSKYNSDTFTRSLKQILHEDVGDQLESAVHFSYVYDMQWLLEQYPSEYQQVPMLLVVQHSDDLLQLLIAQRQVFRNVSLLPIDLARFGTHHSKMISLKYKNHLRVVVTTANLYGPDWGSKTQMVWVSPLLKKSSQPKKGPDSATGFRSALCTYLRSYQKKKLLDLAESYADYDFSSIDRCYFIGSTPNSINSGLLAVDAILTKNIPPLPKDNPVTFCFSSIGTLGQDDTAWLRPILGRALLANDRTIQRATDIKDITVDNIQALYPTIDEVRKSLEGYEAGRSLPYSGRVHMRQRWLSKWLHHWKADRIGRSKAAPHVKFYIRTSADYQQTFWFLMSSANLSKAAWGNLRTKAPLSYECGILYVPDRPVSTDQVVVPFDLPPQRYSSSDRLWVQDNVYPDLDDFGNSWDPRQGGTISAG